MDSWVSDKFYSHFPSYSEQKTHREVLAKSRQLEYQEYLNDKSPQTKNKSQKRLPTNTKTSKRPKVPTKNYDSIVTQNKLDADDNYSNDDVVKENNNDDESTQRFLRKLEEMNVPDIFNDDMIRARNEKVAEVIHE